MANVVCEIDVADNSNNNNAGEDLKTTLKLAIEVTIGVTIAVTVSVSASIAIASKLNLNLGGKDTVFPKILTTIIYNSF